MVLNGKRAKRERHSQVCTIENRGYIWYVQFLFIARGAICSALYCSGKNPSTLGYVSVLEFVSIESYLKAISSNYGSNKSIELQKKCLESAEERARAQGFKCMCTNSLIIVYDKCSTVEVYKINRSVLSPPPSCFYYFLNLQHPNVNTTIQWDRSPCNGNHFSSDIHLFFPFFACLPGPFCSQPSPRNI